VARDGAIARWHPIAPSTRPLIENRVPDLERWTTIGRMCKSRLACAIAAAVVGVAAILLASL
jgi:hypothetical protein